VAVSSAPEAIPVDLPQQVSTNTENYEYYFVVAVAAGAVAAGAVALAAGAVDSVVDSVLPVAATAAVAVAVGIVIELQR